MDHLYRSWLICVKKSNKSYTSIVEWAQKYINELLPDIGRISSSAPISQASLTLSWKSSNEVDAEDDTDLFSFLGLALRKKEKKNRKQMKTF